MSQRRFRARRAARRVVTGFKVANREGQARGRRLSFETLEDRRVLSTTIGILAAGQTGSETMQLQIDGVGVANFNVTQVYNSTTRVFQTFTFTSPNDITADHIRVAFTNDGVSQSGADRNLYVDGITINGVKYESEAPNVFSTGTWDAATNGLLPGYRQSEALHYNGYFQYSTVQQTGPTTITVLAAGQTGTESLQLQIDGVPVANWTTTQVYNANNRVFQTFTYTNPTGVTIDRIRVAFTNDGTTSTGADRNLYVDGVTLNGVKYGTEDPSVYSTGTWDAATNGVLPGFRQTEALHYIGYFQYGAAGVSTPIQIFAAGATGSEQMQLQIGGVTVATFNNVGGNYANGVFQTFTYTHPTKVNVADIKVAFTNDAIVGGQDRNLRVDAITVGGVRYETEAPTTYSTGTYIPNQGVIPGNWRSEYLHANGYFQYAPANTGTTIEIRAAGTTGQEQMQLLISGVPVATFSNIGGDYDAGVFQKFTYVYPSTVLISDVQVAFVNDGTTSGGADKNLRVDGITLGGTVYEAEAANVVSTGTYIPNVGAQPGLWQSEYLHTNGYFQFGSNWVPGKVQLGASIINVNESAGTVSVPVSRTDGSDGTVALRYTTTDGTAKAGSDYTAQTGFVVLAPGQTSAIITIPINNDTLQEGNEAFNISVDFSLGGADVFAPRTATITIADDDTVAQQGNGNGLLGKYYDDIGFQQEIFERTDTSINFNWGTGSPSSSIAPDTFSIRWEGKVQPRFSQTYTFYATTDNGVRLWVNNQLIVDQWNDHTATTYTGTISLLAGVKYDIVMTYYENTGVASAALEWSSASQARQVIPQSQLYSDQPAPPSNGTFSAQPVVGGLFGPTAIDFDNNGRMFIAEQQGVVRIYQNGQLNPQPFLDLRQQVNNVQDRGMIGLAVHPNFPATPYVYVSYTYDPPETLSHTGLAGPDGSGNRVARISRFTADPATNYTTAIPGSEYVLVGKNSTWANISHPELDSTDDTSIPPSGGNNGNGQDILIADSRSHSVGNLAFGPDGMLYAANGDGASFGRVDPRAERVQSLDSLSGKILRIDPITGDGLPDNLWYNGDPTANRSKVYDYGLRNPFRFTFQPGTNKIFIGDVGWNTWEEINVGPWIDYGWPFYEGGNGTSLQTGGYNQLPEAQTFYTTMPNVAPPLWSRLHTDGAVAIVAGDFYTGNLYPVSFKNAMFIDDLGDGQIRILRMNGDGTLNSVTPLGLNAGTVVEMSMGKDGYMYYVDLVGNKVGRIVFTPAGAQVQAAQPGDFNEDGTVDGADFLAWQRGQGTTQAATIADGDADGDGAVGASDLAVWTTGAAPVQGPDSLTIDPAAYWLAFEQPNQQSATDALLEPLAVNDLANSLANANASAMAVESEPAVSSNPYEGQDAAITELTDESLLVWSDAV
jgi:glucose/arabinose dehydrogenase